jgi:hypothetical protein
MNHEQWGCASLFRYCSQLVWSSTMHAIVNGQRGTQGRHAGWILIDNCKDTAKSMASVMGHPSCTMAEIEDMIGHCLRLGLLDAKHCDTNDGRMQQYVKTSSGYEDHKAYTESIRPAGFKELFQDGSAERWWTKDSKGDYHPNGPSSETRERYKPIIERLSNGMRVKESIFNWAPILTKDPM